MDQIEQSSANNINVESLRKQFQAIKRRQLSTLRIYFVIAFGSITAGLFLVLNSNEFVSTQAIVGLLGAFAAIFPLFATFLRSKRRLDGISNILKEINKINTSKEQIDFLVQDLIREING